MVHRVLQTAIDLCDTHPRGVHHRHGALVFKGSKIQGRGINSNNRTRCHGKYFPSMHAEMAAIRDAYGHILVTDALQKWFLHQHKNHKDWARGDFVRKGHRVPRKSSLLVVRINKKEELMESRCCSICIAVMKAVNINRVYYSTNGGLIEEKIKDIVTYDTTGLQKMSDFIGMDPMWIGFYILDRRKES